MPSSIITNHLAKADPVLREIIAEVTPPEIQPSEGVFYDLVSCLLDHQVPQRSRYGVYLKKVKALLNGEAPDAENVLRIDEADWDRHKIANRKYHTLRGLAEHWQQHDYARIDWHALADETVREKLSGIKGIGAQTVDMVLLYTLERPDIFPTGDKHVKEAMTLFYDLAPKPPKAFLESMLITSAPWTPYRSHATRYLLAYKRLDASEPIPA